MSQFTNTITNAHQFVPLEKNTKALNGQRLVRLIAKSSRKEGEKNPNLQESLAVSIPPVTMEQVAEVIDQLIPHVIGMVQDAQDKIIREWRLESGRDEISDEQISIAACIAWMNDNATGERVTKEYLADWFSAEYSNVCRDWINAIAGGNISDVVVEQKTNLMRDMISGWASGKYSPNIPSLRAQLRFIDHCIAEDVADARMNSIHTRAADMLRKKEEELSTDALGF